MAQLKREETGQRNIPETFKNTDMAKIYTMAELAALSDEEYRAYMQEVFAEEKRLSEWRTFRDEVFAERDKVREEAREEGGEIKAIEIAKRFLLMGLSVDDISRGTGLSIDEVNSLKEKVK
ncbi:MAG: hypothetical protein IJ161_00440 [Bacteroidales bacterium]|nr:hypothetical protein [Bacteroidales bacterium]